MIDWVRVTLNLRRHYGPLAKVGREVGSTEKFLNRLARGEVSEPRFGLGVRLLDLHLDHVPNHVSALEER